MLEKLIDNYPDALRKVEKDLNIIILDKLLYEQNDNKLMNEELKDYFEKKLSYDIISFKDGGYEIRINNFKESIYKEISIENANQLIEFLFKKLQKKLNK